MIELEKPTISTKKIAPENTEAIIYYRLRE
jgi:hypothetical protein